MSDDRLIETPAPADRPSFKIRVEGDEVSAEYQVQAVIVTRHFNRVAAADVLVLDGDPASRDFKVSNAEDFLPGKELEILAGYHGNEELIYKGIVIRHGVRVFQNKPSLLRVECRDAAVKLTIGRKSAYFYDQTDAEVIEALAGNAGLESDVETTAVSHAQMVQFYTTDWDFLMTRAEANGKLVSTEDGKLVVRAPDPNQDPVLSLAYGGNLLDFEAFMDARDQFGAVRASAWDAANQERLVLDAAVASAVSPGNVTNDSLAAVIGLDTLELKHAGQIADTELQAWADGQVMKNAFAKVRGRARIQGTAAVALGDLIELGGVGTRFNGKGLVSGIRHEIDTKNWETHITFGLSPEWFGRTAQNLVETPVNGLLPGITSLQIGLVTALEGDPDGEDRVQVRLPLIDTGEEGVWARVATLDAGENRGTFFRPDIGDEVVLGFLNHDPRNPVLLGMLNSSAKPAYITATDDNHEKGIVTRSEIKLLFDDDKIAVSIETPNGNKLVLSDEDGGITLEDENRNKLVLNGDGVTIESASDINITASGDVNIQGVNVSANANSGLTAKGSASAEVSSSGNTVVKGSLVQIN
jgi:Rhs element Vgr protein